MYTTAVITFLSYLFFFPPSAKGLVIIMFLGPVSHSLFLPISLFILNIHFLHRWLIFYWSLFARIILN